MIKSRIYNHLLAVSGAQKRVECCGKLCAMQITDSDHIGCCLHDSKSSETASSSAGDKWPPLQSISVGQTIKAHELDNSAPLTATPPVPPVGSTIKQPIN